MPLFEDAYLLFEREDFAQALFLLDQLVEQEPTQVNVRYLQGICHFRLGHFGKAEGAFRCALGINSDHLESRYYLGLCLERQDRTREARMAYEKVLAIDPSHGMALKKIAELGGSGQTAPKRPEQPHSPPPDVQSHRQASHMHSPTAETGQPADKKTKWKSARHPVGCFLATLRWLLLLGAGAGIGAVIGGTIAKEPGAIGGGVAGALVSQLVQVLTVKRER
ncbi:tetratricopeptide repeat protein [Pseudodesulfovibrio cashew]|uniref:Tetratricopeptide repeat protein n=1 Tax=Pseudodesulfovibrio cashew TaxID=2678688 RepID=A0A6I6JAH4_9BACT|nr:tetratricopeptide repeat protein [Pseudodesulfovibrio cashew]QGY39061.1 tetratricopeptide repeat protein [Pseudodesulfovibrio cashew]